MGRDGHVWDLRTLWPVVATEEAEKAETSRPSEREETWTKGSVNADERG